MEKIKLLITVSSQSLEAGMGHVGALAQEHALGRRLPWGKGILSRSFQSVLFAVTAGWGGYHKGEHHGPIWPLS